jgi:transcriptional regulator with PAS, ATPase and Fis domain
VEIALKATRNAAMREVLAKIERVAYSDLSVLLVGEPGTGKEWAAHIIHKSSARASGPFYPVDCATLSPDSLEKELFGYEAITWRGVEIKRSAFEEASGGTLLLDEIASIPPATQKKIARVVEYLQVRRISGEEDIPVNVRVVATLSQQPDKVLSDGELQKELYYRISPIVIELPPLRERKEDINLLIDWFIQELNARYGCSIQAMSQEALALCLRYDWPGNVRHLKNAIEHAAVMCVGQVIRPEHLPVYLYNRHS